MHIHCIIFKFSARFLQVKQLKKDLAKLEKEVSQKTESIPSLPPASAAAAATSADQPMTEEVLSYMFFLRVARKQNLIKAMLSRQQIKNSLKARVTGQIKVRHFPFFL